MAKALLVPYKSERLRDEKTANFGALSCEHSTIVLDRTRLAWNPLWLAGKF
jgi:hypothetical protein